MKISKLNMLKMNKRMQSTVSLRSIPGTSTTGMTHHVKGYQKDISPDANILHHGINDLKNGNNSEKKQKFLYQDSLSEMKTLIKYEEKLIKIFKENSWLKN